MGDDRSALVWPKSQPTIGPTAKASRTSTQTKRVRTTGECIVGPNGSNLAEGDRAITLHIWVLAKTGLILPYAVSWYLYMKRITPCLGTPILLKLRRSAVAVNVGPRAEHGFTATY